MSEQAPELAKHQFGHTSNRFRLSLKAMTALAGRVTVAGEENLHSLAGQRVIVATTHLKDFDLPVAAAFLSDFFDIALTDISEHSDFFKFPGTWIGARIAGERFLPIDYRTDGKTPNQPNQDNFRAITAAMDMGKTIIIAGHNPTYNDLLPAKGGLGAIHLARSTGALIIPAAVNVESSGGVGNNPITTFLHRPRTNLIIGEPLSLGESEFKEIPPQEDTAVFRAWIRETRAHSDTLMKAFASMLPPEKRGSWA